MASKSITELDAIQLSQISSNDSFVLEHSNNAMRLTAQTFLAWTAEELDGHGGISSVEKTSTEGLVDTYTLTYGDGTTTTFSISNGAKGDKGDTGDTGETGSPAVLESSAVAYQKSDDGTTPPTGTWSSTIPEIVSGEFLWTRTTLTFNTGSPVVFYSVSSAGQDGSGTGTVTSVGITAGAGMSVSGSPITSSGSITVGHSNSVTANPQNQWRKFGVDAQGHITSYQIVDIVDEMTGVLQTSRWNSRTKEYIFTDPIRYIHGFVIVMVDGDPTAYNNAKIYYDAPSGGQIKFHALGDLPTSDINIRLLQIDTGDLG